MEPRSHLEIPHARLPEYLEGLRLPASVPEVLTYAEEHGAPPGVLDFLESLPASVFTSEEGLRHAFSAVGPEDLPATHPEDVLVGEDGTSS